MPEQDLFTRGLIPGVQCSLVRRVNRRISSYLKSSERMSESNSHWDTIDWGDEDGDDIDATPAVLESDPVKEERVVGRRSSWFDNFYASGESDPEEEPRERNTRRMSTCDDPVSSASKGTSKPSRRSSTSSVFNLSKLVPLGDEADGIQTNQRKNQTRLVVRRRQSTSDWEYESEKRSHSGSLSKQILGMFSTKKGLCNDIDASDRTEATIDVDEDDDLDVPFPTCPRRRRQSALY